MFLDYKAPGCGVLKISGNQQQMIERVQEHICEGLTEQ